MSGSTKCVAFILGIGLLVSFGTRVAEGQVRVVDMLPASMSDETRNNPEPYIAVNPANPNILAATAFMPTPAGSPNGPMLVSTDGGVTWSAQNIIPSSAGATYNTGDITIHFNGVGTVLYAGQLGTGVSGMLQITATADMTLTTPMTQLNTPRATDQPYTYARTVTGWFDPGLDRVWVGNNEGAVSPASATIDQTLDAGTATPAFTQIRIDKGSPVARDNYQVRTVAGPDGHAYAAFIRRTGAISGGYNADIVVVRDDNWGKGASPFTQIPVAVNVASVPISDTGASSSTLGNEWWGGDLYLTVDPNDAANVYISYSTSEAAAPRTLHLRRSNDYGQTWGSDLLATGSGKNAAIAVNSHGRIAYVYQQLTGTSPNQRWQTHLRRSSDGGTTWDDVTLADFPAAGTGAPIGIRIIGDYMNMVAVGKNFYGVFSSSNDLVNASFPAGVTWLRNHTAAGAPTPSFLGVDGTTVVAPSVDPFFFATTEVDPADDFYVRDWTDDASTHDHGQEPSVRGNFYSTSDVWNRRSDDPSAFDPNDRPQVQDPQPATMGHNYAFARVTREASGSAADVSLSYLYSDGGVGVPYVSAGAPSSIHLSAVQSDKTPAAGKGYQWDLPSGASNHVCLAVEIATSNDPVLAPSLLGRAPGWPTTDLMVVADNNKAQRNMQVFGFGGMTADATTQSRIYMYAIIHNAALSTRDISLGIGVDSLFSRAMADGRLQVVGGQEPTRIAAGDILTLPRMAPGENRWVEFSCVPARSDRADGPASLAELRDGIAVNDYGFRPISMPLTEAIRQTLLQHAAVMARLAADPGVAGARSELERVLRLTRQKNLDAKGYLTFVRQDASVLTRLARAYFQQTNEKDVLGVLAAAKELAASKSAPQAQIIHLSLLNRLDAAQTVRQKKHGDVAEIPQDLRWLRGLLVNALGSEATGAVSAIDDFLAGFERRKFGVERFPALLKGQLETLQLLAAKDTGGEARKRLDRIPWQANPAAVQQAHHDMLMAVYHAIGG